MAKPTAAAKQNTLSLINDKDAYTAFLKKVDDMAKTSGGSYVFTLNQKVVSTAQTELPSGELAKEEGSAFPRFKTIKNPCVVYDPALGADRVLRLLNGYTSIWKDEQDKPAPLEQREIDAAIVEVAFRDGLLTVGTPENANLFRFLMLHDENELRKNRKSSKPPVFRLVNEAEDVSNELEAIERKDKAIELCKKVTADNFEEHLHHIEYMNVATRNRAGELLPAANILVNYRKAAESQPDRFLKSFESAEVKLRSKIQKAIADGKIDLARVKGQAFYDSGKLICDIPFDTDPVKALVEHAVTNDSFNKILQQW